MADDKGMTAEDWAALDELLRSAQFRAADPAPAEPKADPDPDGTATVDLLLEGSEGYYMGALERVDRADWVQFCYSTIRFVMREGHRVLGRELMFVVAGDGATVLLNLVRITWALGYAKALADLAAGRIDPAALRRPGPGAS